jgi:small basic protein (TIGR04137 family)
MSIDKSLKRKSNLVRPRSVLTREERIKTLQAEERWKEGQGPLHLPKVRVMKIVLKKAKKAKAEEGAEGATPAAGAAAPAAGAAAPKAGAAAAKPAGDKKK